MSLWIAVDGFDGVGKSTIIDFLVKEYGNKYKISIDHLLPKMVSLFKKYSNNTNNYIKSISIETRVLSYLVESYIHLDMKKNIYDKFDIIFFDRWIYTNLVQKLDFGKDNHFVDFFVRNIPKPDYLFLLKADSENIISHLKQKNDWMLTFYKEDEIKHQAAEFYCGYEKVLCEAEFKYWEIDGNKCLHTLQIEIKNIFDRYILKGDKRT